MAMKWDSRPLILSVLSTLFTAMSAMAQIAPVASDQSLTTFEDTAKSITLLATDVDGDSLTYAVAASPAHGTLTGTPPDLTYLPVTDYYGPDSFTFIANDGSVDSNTATISISVAAVNDAPAGTVKINTGNPEATGSTLGALEIDSCRRRRRRDPDVHQQHGELHPLVGVFAATRTGHSRAGAGPRP